MGTRITRPCLQSAGPWMGAWCRWEQVGGRSSWSRLVSGESNTYFIFKEEVSKLFRETDRVN